MFGSPKKRELKSLQKNYEKLLIRARDLQRNGKIPEYALVMGDADEIRKKIEVLEAELTSTPD